MKKELEDSLIRSKQKQKENELLFRKLKKAPRKSLDPRFHEEHDKTFNKIDCLDCGNCCKTTSPIFTDQDIKRLAKLFKVKPVQFINEYLRMDEQRDYVLKTAPCPFLQNDNTCFVYDVRPNACREFPHTNRKNMYQILDLTLKNTLVCPAVAEIVEEIEKKQPTKKQPF